MPRDECVVEKLFLRSAHNTSPDTGGESSHVMHQMHVFGTQSDPVSVPDRHCQALFAFPAPSSHVSAHKAQHSPKTIGVLQEAPVCATTSISRQQRPRPRTLPASASTADLVFRQFSSVSHKFIIEADGTTSTVKSKQCMASHAMSCYEKLRHAAEIEARCHKSPPASILLQHPARNGRQQAARTLTFTLKPLD